MTIRKSTEKDIIDIMNIYELAKAFMVNNNNATQWNKGYPGEEILKQDINKGQSYVCVKDENVVGTFTFIIGEEPTYQRIEQGKWHYDRAYGTIHRLASNGKARGIAKECFDYCTDKMDYIRIDTHRNNQQMQAAIKKYGFKECGIIYVRDGSERIAFDYKYKLNERESV